MEHQLKTRGALHDAVGGINAVLQDARARRRLRPRTIAIGNGNGADVPRTWRSPHRVTQERLDQGWKNITRKVTGCPRGSHRNRSAQNNTLKVNCLETSDAAQDVSSNAANSGVRGVMAMCQEFDHSYHESAWGSTDILLCVPRLLECL